MLKYKIYIFLYGPMIFWGIFFFIPRAVVDKDLRFLNRLRIPKSEPCGAWHAGNVEG